jgi:shikimate kinase
MPYRTLEKLGEARRAEIVREAGAFLAGLSGEGPAPTGQLSLDL